MVARGSPGTTPADAHRGDTDHPPGDEGRVVFFYSSVVRMFFMMREIRPCMDCASCVFMCARDMRDRMCPATLRRR